MKTLYIPLIAAVTLLPGTLRSQDEQEKKDASQDRRIEALTERVIRLEALAGRDAQPLPTKPSMDRRLDRLERDQRLEEAREAVPAEDVDVALRDLRRTLQTTTRRVEMLTQRMDRLERNATKAPETYEIRDLRRDVDRLQRQLESLKHRF